MTAALSILADIGGTNTRVALAYGQQVDAASIRRFSNAEVSGLEPILRRYLDETGIASVEGVCVAVAGPVRDGVAERVVVVSGVRDGGMISIVEGLEPGDLVVTRASAFVRDGDAIRPVVAEDAAIVQEEG